MFKQIDKYHMRLDDWTICKVLAQGKWIYELWHGTELNGYFDSADEAKTKHELLTKESK